jgi:hypothetical protein
MADERVVVDPTCIGPYGVNARDSVDQQVIEDWVTYRFRGQLTIPSINDPAGFRQTTDQNIKTVDGTGHFDLMFVTGTINGVSNAPNSGGTLDPGSLSVGAYKLRVRNGEDGNTLTADEDWIDSRNFVGSAERPCFIAGRKRFRANTNIIVEFALINVNRQSLTPVVYNIEVVFNGVKVKI